MFPLAGGEVALVVPFEEVIGAVVFCRATRGPASAELASKSVASDPMNIIAWIVLAFSDGSHHFQK